tara:strand:+ start:8883 stop:9074 length:192 start_codon:yes stop_codon:yes gene_type:complete
MNKTENKLTLKEIIHIIDNRLLHKCTKEERKQIMDFAFGDEYGNDEKTIRQRIKEKYDKNERH